MKSHEQQLFIFIKRLQGLWSIIKLKRLVRSVTLPVMGVACFFAGAHAHGTGAVASENDRGKFSAFVRTIAKRLVGGFATGAPCVFFAFFEVDPDGSSASLFRLCHV